MDVAIAVVSYVLEVQTRIQSCSPVKYVNFWDISYSITEHFSYFLLFLLYSFSFKRNEKCTEKKEYRYLRF